MEKQKRWQSFLIIAVVALTVYNILPTIFYYSKPLRKPIDKPQADKIATQIVQRVNALEEGSIEWLRSFCRLLKVKPLKIAIDAQDPQYAALSFATEAEAQKFRRYLPKAGNLIPFAPAQLSLAPEKSEGSGHTAIVQREIPLHFNEEELNEYFAFSEKRDQAGEISDLYRNLVSDRALELGVALGGTSENAQFLQAIARAPGDPQVQELTVRVCQNILAFAKAFPESSSIAQRYFASYTQAEGANPRALAESFLSAISRMKEQVASELKQLQEKSAQLREEQRFLETLDQQQLELLSNREQILSSAEILVKKEFNSFASGQSPLTYIPLGKELRETSQETALQTLSLQDRNPFIASLTIDWSNETFQLGLHADLLAYKDELEKQGSFLLPQVDQFIYNAIAAAAQQAGEEVTPRQQQFEVALNALPDSKSFLVFKLSTIASKEIKQLKQNLEAHWEPKSTDFAPEAFPISAFDRYTELPTKAKKLGLVLYSPALYNKTPPKGFRMNSIYVIAKGVDKILQKQQASSGSQQSQQFLEDFRELQKILQENGFFGYSGSAFALAPEFAEDFIFEKQDYFQTVLKATREAFAVHGTKRYAVLEFSDLEQRILTENRIDTRTHEDLLKWRDDYRAAQVDITKERQYDVPAPTHNVLLDNLKLSTIKYFRGDDRKVLHWGLDLSGGKTVQIELRDGNNRPVADPEDVNQGINELYKRVNKMGVSEVSIRQEGDFITLDFPGAQGLSAAELVKSSSMYFHVVNEEYSPYNPELGESVNHFLQEVWNEAVVTNKKSPEEVNQIAWKHLYGDALDAEAAQPRSYAAKALFDHGLRLESPMDAFASGDFNELISKIALFRGDNYTEWQGQTHPLLIVFRNYALEGSNLENVQASYDPSKGNFLSFNVAGSQTTSKGDRVNPRDLLYAWTSQFSQEKIEGTARDRFTRGKGWRMAVVLNGSVISSPNLQSPLSDSAMITGSFSQREVNLLEADLKAGSLSFTPHILSEKNVSPELGAKERSYGILATLLALALVVAVMVIYYRFAGFIASLALLFNLLIMWATLQNLQATLTLAGIAGLILTLGMAVDANVLVFERMREEFRQSGRLASAVHAGYKKAFSAIIDSNLTTIIAAVILLNFDSGPIKAFAVTLIIGIGSSMFTALFLTRYFFAGWVQNPKHKELKMLNLIGERAINFMKFAKPSMLITSAIVIIGTALVVAKRHTIFGMDFSGGYALTVEVAPKPGSDYRSLVESALEKEGVTSREVQIRELSPPNQLRIFFSRSLDQPGFPFYELSSETEREGLSYSYENNPKIVWLVDALEKSAVHLTPESLDRLESNWAEVSGQMSDAMRINALIGLCLAILGIMVYITIRFEFKYAISATLCTVHDVLFSIASIGILALFGVPIQIDLITVAALLTIIGYSLNDTIIIFDRIREDLRVMRKHKFLEVVNHALNVTLSRTVMTSGTTLTVLLPLVVLGGSTIFGFALVMAIGVIFGTLSSLFIAAPLLHYFHLREERRVEISSTS